MPRSVGSRRLLAGVAAAALALGLALAGCGAPVSNQSPQTQSESGEDLPGWKAIFTENFLTPAPLGTFLNRYGDKWGAYPYPYQDTSHTLRSDPGYYYPQKTLSVKNGYLDAWLHYDAALGRYLVAAPIPKLPTMQYGRFALRLRADDIRGYKIAPLLWPDSGNGEDGEINLPEGLLNGSNFQAFIHLAGPNAGQAAFGTGTNGHSWHVYETLWSPGRIELLVDGQSIGTVTASVPTKPMHWILQFETAIQRTSPPTDSQGHVQVDWAKAYSYEGPGK